MAAPTTEEAALLQSALGPKRVRVGNEEVEQHSLRELQEVCDRTAGDTGRTKNHLGLMFRKLIPTGAG